MRSGGIPLHHPLWLGARGFPYKTGRAHNFFNSTPPWKVEMKKLQGTRAGRPIAIAFDMELLMQMGFKLFATDECQVGGQP
jgi:hypothetical protein